MAKVISEKQLTTRYPKLALSVTALHFNMRDFPEHMEKIKKRLLDERTKLDGLQRQYFIHVEDNYFKYVIDYELFDYDGRWPVSLRLREVTVYDSYVEYEAARFTTLGSVPPDEQKGINYN